MDFTKFGGIIFDLDGTLIESNHVWQKIDENFLGKRGIAVPENYFKVVSTMNFQAAAIYTNDAFHLGERIEDIQNEWYEMAIDEYSHSIRLVKGADRFIEELKSAGVKIALATASSKSLYEPVLKNNGIYEYFDAFTTTEEVNRGKGYPDVYELACERICKTPQSCAVFEDIIEGIIGAKAGGFTAVACLNKHYQKDWEKLKEQAEYSFFTYDEIKVTSNK